MNWIKKKLKMDAIADIDDATMRAFFENTNEKTRSVALLVAKWEYSRLEDRLTSPGKLDEAELNRIRGGMEALRRFMSEYINGVEEWGLGHLHQGKERGKI